MPFKVETRTPFFTFSDSPFIPVYSLLFALFWVYTGVTTSNFTNWWLENTLTLPFLILLFFVYRWHKFSTISVSLIFIFLMLHVYGSQHTYAENPFGYWLKNTWQLERNHFDRIVHFSFGFLLAFPLHELARDKFKIPTWFAFVVPLELILSLSALYEVAEWAVADIVYKKQGPSFLGMQGDIWDAQKDIALALTGAMLMMLATYFNQKGNLKAHKKTR